MLDQLQPGDVLSYSAGTTSTRPDGFRKLTRPSASGGRGPLLDTVGRYWPDLLTGLDERPPLFVNAYPAAAGLAHGVSVDTYLSPRILTRALQLGRVARHPTILLGQPLFLADQLLRHVGEGWPLPARLMVWVGGYALPRSLERLLEAAVAPHVDAWQVLHFFGAAEVDGGCLVARERDADGEPIFHPRADVRAEVDGDELLLTLLGADGRPRVERFRTGDRARRHGGHDGGWRIDNPRRIDPVIARALESWSDADWRRRTGYVRRDGDRLWVQLRQGAWPESPDELRHFDFADRFGFSWLDKPTWR